MFLLHLNWQSFHFSIPIFLKNNFVFFLFWKSYENSVGLFFVQTLFICFSTSVERKMAFELAAESQVLNDFLLYWDYHNCFVIFRSSQCCKMGDITLWYDVKYVSSGWFRDTAGGKATQKFLSKYVLLVLWKRSESDFVRPDKFLTQFSKHAPSPRENPRSYPSLLPCPLTILKFPTKLKLRCKEKIEKSQISKLRF